MTFLFLDKGTFAVLATAHQNSDMFRSTLLLFALVCLIGFLSSAGQANAQVSPTEQPAKALERQVPVGQLLWDAHGTASQLRVLQDPSREAEQR